MSNIEQMKKELNTIGHIVDGASEYHVCGYAFDFTPRLFFQIKAGGKIYKRALRYGNGRYFFRFNGNDYFLRK